MDVRSLKLHKERLKYVVVGNEARKMISKDFFACFRLMRWTHRDLFGGMGILFGCTLLIAFISRLKYFGIDSFHLFMIVLSADICFKCTLFYYPFHLCNKRHIRPLSSFLPVYQIPKEVCPALFFCFLIFLSTTLFTWLITCIYRQQLSIPDMWLWQSDVSKNGYVFLYLIALILLFPFIEEIFFRGFLYNALKQSMPKFHAAFLQSFIFSLLHPYDPMNRISIFIAGLFFVIAYERRGNLISPILVHYMFNLVSLFRMVYSQ